MSKLSNFLNHNLDKTLWSLAILVWVGVGVYYFSTRTPSSSEQAPISLEVPTPAVSENLDEVEFIVGNFQKWEEINGSKDRYILLTDPKTGKFFPKIRVGFEFTTLYCVEGSGDITDFVIEKDKEEYDLLFALNFFTYEEIDRLVKKGDPIKIFFKRKLEEGESLRDELDNPLAQWLLVEGEKTEIEQIIGREIPKP